MSQSASVLAKNIIRGKATMFQSEEVEPALCVCTPIFPHASCVYHLIPNDITLTGIPQITIRKTSSRCAEGAIWQWTAD